MVTGWAPFSDTWQSQIESRLHNNDNDNDNQDRQSGSKMYESILTKPVEFLHYESKLTAECKAIVSHLLLKNADLRLGSGKNGINDVKNHKWFKSIKWDLICLQKIKSPYKPNVDNNKDLRHFEFYSVPEIGEQLKHDPDGTIYGWCQDF